MNETDKLAPYRTAFDDAAHVFDLTGYSELIDQTADGAGYYLRIKGEGGSNSSNGTLIRSVVAYFTVTLVTPGG